MSKTHSKTSKKTKEGAQGATPTALHSIKKSAKAPSMIVPPATQIMLEKLQEKSPVISLELEGAHERLYNHLVQAYRWWQKAVKIEGYIDAEYEKLDPRKSSGEADPNFIPVIRIVWGANGNLKNQYAQRYSRALNAIHIQYEANPEHYKVGAIAKLTNFIKDEGGVSKLAGYAPAKEGPAEKHQAKEGRKQQATQEKEAKAATVESAVKAAVSHSDSTSVDNVDLSDYVPLNTESFFLVLMKQTADGRKAIATSHDQQLIETVLVASHRKRFEAHDSVTRPLLELIQTQCYPVHLKDMAKDLADPNTLLEFKGENRKSARRVMFLHEMDQFLLSPIRAQSGVVSLITPDEYVLSKSTQDVFMPLYQRNILEQELLQSFDFSLYDTDGANDFPEHNGDHSASHALSLAHCVDQSKNIDLHFWPFYDSFPQPLDQVGLNPDYEFKSQWQATLPHSYFKKLADQHIDPWLNGLGNHLKRDYNELMKVAFEEKCLDIAFKWKDGKFEGREVVEFDTGSGSKEAAECHFLSKDWELALRSIALLPVEGEVSLSVNEEVLRIAFRTIEDGGSEHEIHIPTVDLDCNRSTAPFKRYQPEIVPDDNLQSIDPAENDLLALDTVIAEAEVQL
jgi:hypothetical protein